MKFNEEKLSESESVKVTGLETPYSLDVITTSQEDFDEKMRAFIGPEWHDELPKLWKEGTIVTISGVILSATVKQ